MSANVIGTTTSRSAQGPGPELWAKKKRHRTRRIATAPLGMKLVEDLTIQQGHSAFIQLFTQMQSALLPVYFASKPYFRKAIAAAVSFPGRSDASLKDHTPSQQCWCTRVGASCLCRSVIREKNGGGEIRTRETLTGPPVFKTGAFNRSATPPVSGWILSTILLHGVIVLGRRITRVHALDHFRDQARPARLMGRAAPASVIAIEELEMVDQAVGSAGRSGQLLPVGTQERPAGRLASTS